MTVAAAPKAETPKVGRNQIDPAIRAGSDPDPKLTISAEKAAELDQWLTESIKMVRQDRTDDLLALDNYRRVLKGERNTPSPRSGASNISVPFLVWIVSSVRERFYDSIFGSSGQSVSVRPLKGTVGEEAASSLSVAASLGRLVSAELRNPRGLDGEAAIRAASSEDAWIGSGAIKVVYEPMDVRKVRGQQVDLPARVRWVDVPIEELLYWNGYGADTSRWPFVGHEVEKSWIDLTRWVHLGHYDRDAVNEVAAFFEERKLPTHLQPHRVAELYLDFDIDGDGIPESLVVDWHLAAEKRLRTRWSRYPRGERPIKIAAFDLNPDAKKAVGQGVCEKFINVQDEIDEIHNLGIEAGKRAAANILIGRENSMLSRQLGTDPIIPGEFYVTENVDEDAKSIELGSAEGAQVAMGLEERARQYALHVLGLGDPSQGDVSSGKRVPNQLGMTISREGRVVIRGAIASFVRMVTEGLYLTLELWREHLPVESMLSVLTTDEIIALQNAVFTLSGESMRSSFQVTITAQDVAVLNEERKNELFILNNFLMSFHKATLETAATVRQLQNDPTLARIGTLILERMEKGVEALLTTLDSIPDPAAVLVSVGEVSRILQGVGTSEPTVGINNPEADIEGRGGGVV